MPPTARLAIPVPLETDTPDVPRDIGLLADRLDLIAAFDAQGTIAARPAAGVRGRYYWATDVGVLYRDDGAAWSPVSAAASAQQFLDAPGRAFQEGAAAGAVATPVTYQTGALIRVLADSAWIDGDGLACVGSGRYRVSWAQTDLVVPAAVAGRLDQVIVRLQGGWGVAPSVELLQGADGGGITLDNRTGAAALPAGCFRVADVLVNPAVANQQAIRDRRTWSRGVRARVIRSQNAAAGNDYTTGPTGTWVLVDSTNLMPRVELSGAPVKVKLSCCLGAPGSVGFSLRAAIDAVNGGVFDEYAGTGIGESLFMVQLATAAQAQGGGNRRMFEWTAPAPTPGSHQVGIQWAGDGANVITMAARAGAPVVLTIEEDLRAAQANG